MSGTAERDAARHVHIPRPSEVPEDLHERVVDQVHRSITAPQTSATPALAAWEADALGPPPDGQAEGDEAAVRARLEASGLSEQAYRAVASAGRRQWMAQAQASPAPPGDLPTTSIIIALPTLIRAPYAGSAWWQTVTGGGGWKVEAATAFPNQPNGQPRESDPTSGLVGTGLAIDDDGDWSTDSIVVSEFEMVGAWVRTRSAQQYVSASITPSAVQMATTGSTKPFIGGGWAILTSGTQIECFTGNESADHSDGSSATEVATWSTSSFDGAQHHTPSIQVQTPAFSTHYPAGTWIWVMAGTYQKISASVTAPNFCQASIFATMTVSNLTLWL